MVMVPSTTQQKSKKKNITRISLAFNTFYKGTKENNELTAKVEV